MNSLFLRQSQIVSPVKQEVHSSKFLSQAAPLAETNVPVQLQRKDDRALIEKSRRRLTRGKVKDFSSATGDIRAPRRDHNIDRQRSRHFDHYQNIAHDRHTLFASPRYNHLTQEQPSRAMKLSIMEDCSDERKQKRQLLLCLSNHHCTMTGSNKTSDTSSRPAGNQRGSVPSVFPARHKT